MFPVAIPILAGGLVVVGCHGDVAWTIQCDTSPQEASCARRNDVTMHETAEEGASFRLGSGSFLCSSEEPRDAMLHRGIPREYSQRALGVLSTMYPYPLFLPTLHDRRCRCQMIRGAHLIIYHSNKYP